MSVISRWLWKRRLRNGGLSTVFDGLKHSNYEIHDLAEHRLSRLDLSTDDAIELIEAATEQYPNNNTNARLLRRFCNEMQPGYVAAVERVYDRLQGNETREIALRLLTELSTPEALTAMARLLKRPSTQHVDLECAFVPLNGSEFTTYDPKPEGTAIFPELLSDFEPIAKLDTSKKVYELILDYAEHDLLSLDEHPDFVSFCVRRALAIIEHDMPDIERLKARKKGRSDFSSDRVSQLLAAVDELQMICDLFRFTDSPLVSDVLSDSISAPTPGVQLFTAITMIAKNEGVDDATLESLAARPALRHRLWSLLDRIDRLDQFPTRFGDQQSLAEAELVMWLEFPTEMGRPPQEIELLRVEELESQEGVRQTSYVYRFRSDDFHEGKWLLGLAGPYASEGPPRIGARNTFSHFGEYDPHGLEEAIQSLIRRREADEDDTL